MTWTLRYASHLGYRSADAPLYPESVGSLDPVAHVEFAAGLGFSGVQYALARSRPVPEQEAVARALARHGLEWQRRLRLDDDLSYPILFAR